MRELYAKLDVAMADSLRRSGLVPSCRSGCDGCCYLLALIGYCEALPIAEVLLERPAWRPTAKALARHAQLCGPEITKEEWFLRAVPCPLLGEDRLCTVYDVRPAPCRYHFVVTPPENCCPGAADSSTARVNTSEALSYVWREDIDLHRRRPELGPACAAPIGLVVLVAMVAAARGAKRAALGRLLDGLPSPVEWYQRHQKYR